MKDLHFIEACHGEAMARLVEAQMAAAPQVPPPDPFAILDQIQLRQFIQQHPGSLSLGDARTNS